VWSWRPDAGADLAMMLHITSMTVTTKPGLTAESTKETVKTIAQGRPVAPAEPVVLPRAFFMHADHGCSPHPAFPAPSVFDEGGLMEKLGRHAPRDSEVMSVIFARPVLRDARKRAPQDEVGVCGVNLNPHGEEAQSAVSNHEAGLFPQSSALPYIRSPMLTIFWHCGSGHFSSRTAAERRAGNQPSTVLLEDLAPKGSGNADEQRKVRKWGGGGFGHRSFASGCVRAHPP
jgi:hypothetical protein